MTTPAKKNQAAQAVDESQAPQLEKVKLIAPHKHAGEKCKAGDEIEVNSIEKAFLLRHNKIAGENQDAAPAAQE